MFQVIKEILINSRKQKSYDLYLLITRQQKYKLTTQRKLCPGKLKIMLLNNFVTEKEVKNGYYQLCKCTKLRTHLSKSMDWAETEEQAQYYMHLLGHKKHENLLTKLSV